MVGHKQFWMAWKIKALSSKLRIHFIKANKRSDIKSGSAFWNAIAASHHNDKSLISKTMNWVLSLGYVAKRCQTKIIPTILWGQGKNYK